MTGSPPDHAEFDALAAGYALHALEPDEKQRLASHAAACPRCQRSMAGFFEVAAALAETAPAAEPSHRLAERIMAAARAGEAPAGGPAGPAAGGRQARTAADSPVVPLRRERGRRWLRPAAAAAAIVLVCAGGIWAGLAATRSGPAAPACTSTRSCREVVLSSAVTHRVAGKVIASGREVWMAPTAMPANTADEIYVLWQRAGARVRPIGSFSVRAGQHAPIRIGGLAAPYSDTGAFMVSLQHGRVIPATPSAPVAVGVVS